MQLRPYLRSQPHYLGRHQDVESIPPGEELPTLSRLLAQRN